MALAFDQIFHPEPKVVIMARLFQPEINSVLNDFFGRTLNMACFVNFR